MEDLNIGLTSLITTVLYPLVNVGILLFVIKMSVQIANIGFDDQRHDNRSKGAG